MSVSLQSEVQRLKPDATWTALAERSGDSALLLHKKRRRASLAAAVQHLWNIRPHPCPLPQARENFSPAACTKELMRNSFALRFAQPKRGDRWVDSRIGRDVRLLFPLPGGEGQGEGGRNP